MDKKKLKTQYTISLVITISFLIISLGHLEYHKLIPALISAVLTLISFLYTKKVKKFLEKESKR